MAHYEKKAGPWVATLRENNVESLCLFPLIHNGVITGYLYITNFDVSDMERIKQTIELIAFFLTAEVANHTFLERLEYLSNVDMFSRRYFRTTRSTGQAAMSLPSSPLTANPNLRKR